MLYNVQVKSRLLLPDIELQAGAVRRLGTQAIGGNATIDLWDGLYLEETRCTLKNIRASQFSEKEKRVRYTSLSVIHVYLSKIKTEVSERSGNMEKDLRYRPRQTRCPVARCLFFRGVTAVCASLTLASDPTC